MRELRINCKRVYDTGSVYGIGANELIEIRKRLNNISLDIKEIWSGGDSHNFLESFNAHIYDLNNLINFLNGSEKVLKNVALNHNRYNHEFVKRVENNERDKNGN